jgi:cbb3-type cytochrome oxidase subunit 3
MKFSQILNVAIIPLLVVIGGLAISYQRKKRARYAQATKEDSGEV